MICVSIAQLSPKEILALLPKQEMAEIRIDLIDATDEELRSIFSSHPCLIATCRLGKYDDNQRLEKLKLAIDAGAAYVDVEVDGQELVWETIKEYVEDKSCQLILSYHNFDFTPHVEDLIELIDSCFMYGAAIAKVACQVETKEDAENLLMLYDEYDDVVLIGMGELGIETRVKALSLGAPFTFASLEKGKETAPGQIDKETLQALINKV